MNGLGERWQGEMERVGLIGWDSVGLGLKGVGVVELGRDGWGVNEWVGREKAG